MKPVKTLLSENEEMVITMRFSGMTPKQIAAVIGKSVRSVRRLDRTAWLKLHCSYATIAQWERLVASGESMKKIANTHIKHSLADVMT